MVSIRVVVVAVLALAVIAQALPPYEGVVPEDEHHVYEPAHGDRHRRVTCDLLSVDTPFGSLNHAACAAHCLSMGKGYRGGRCIDGVCNCRR